MLDSSEENIEMFHMVDFDTRHGDFTGEKGWDESRRRRVLDELLEIIAEAPIKNGLGFTNRVFVKDPSQHFTDTYENNLVDCLMHLANKSAYEYSDDISVIFAKHNDYRKERVLRIFNFMDYGDARLATLGVSDPRRVRPLQAADLIAYEFKKLSIKLMGHFGAIRCVGSENWGATFVFLLPPRAPG
jgi:hypothetical protein